jgi:hypothetical protein
VTTPTGAKFVFTTASLRVGVWEWVCGMELGLEWALREWVWERQDKCQEMCGRACVDMWRTCARMSGDGVCTANLERMHA